jgi:hypothetical protein
MTTPQQAISIPMGTWQADVVPLVGRVRDALRLMPAGNGHSGPQPFANSQAPLGSLARPPLFASVVRDDSDT